VLTIISSASYIVNKTRSSLETNTVYMNACFRSWLSNDIWVRKRLCYLLFVTEF